MSHVTHCCSSIMTTQASTELKKTSYCSCVSLLFACCHLLFWGFSSDRKRVHLCTYCVSELPVCVSHDFLSSLPQSILLRWISSVTADVTMLTCNHDNPFFCCAAAPSSPPPLLLRASSSSTFSPPATCLLLSSSHPPPPPSHLLLFLICSPLLLLLPSLLFLRSPPTSSPPAASGGFWQYYSSQHVFD